MTGNPYYELLSLLNGQRGLHLLTAELADAQRLRFASEGHTLPVAGMAAGLSIGAEQEGQTFLCAGTAAGFYVLCRLEER